MYSEKELDAAKFDGVNLQTIINNLNPILLDGGYLSLAEEDFMCSFLDGARRDTDENDRLDLHEYADSCENYLFTTRYLCHHNNLSGYFKSYNGLGEIPQGTVVKDLDFLNRQYEAWKLLIESDRHSDPILQRTAKETRDQLKEYNKVSSYAGDNLKKANRKSIILHSKYLYLKIKKFYQETSTRELTINRCGHEIVLDCVAYTHILFRHYAESKKQHQQGATYHMDQEIDPEYLPTALLGYIDQYSQYIDCSAFDGDSLYIKIRGVIYAIWLQQAIRHVQGRQEPILRVKTFYPAALPKDIVRISKLTEFITPNGMGVFR